MIIIPPQLKGWRFILVNKPGTRDSKGKLIDKAAFERAWQTTNNYSIEDPKLNDWLRENGNYGVLPTGRHLIIDIDKNGMGELRDRIIQRFGPTFSVRTPHDGEHRYLVMHHDQESLSVPLIDFNSGENIGHLRAGAGGYVVGPGSRIEEITYAVSDGMPPRHSEQLDDPRLILAEWIKNNEPARFTEKPGKSDLPPIQIVDVGHLSNFTLRGGDFYGPSPTHGSKAGLNNVHISPAKNLWKCFACDSGGDGWYWLAVNEGIIPCWEAKPKRLVGEAFKKTKQRAIELALIEERRSIKESSARDRVADRVRAFFGGKS